MLIYESHIGLFTKSTNSQTSTKGTYSALKKNRLLKRIRYQCCRIFYLFFEWDDRTGNLNREVGLLKKCLGI